jgi:hypothetical protein
VVTLETTSFKPAPTLLQRMGSLLALNVIHGAAKVWSLSGSTADKLRRRVLLAPQRLTLAV